ncbi:MAG: 5-oxoprolinase subunit PxpB [Deltaproteobacteria bacterium]|nr:5-oxoprolinase subunit PxpB [Deltaproteobacteria bacterium]
MPVRDVTDKLPASPQGEAALLVYLGQGIDFALNCRVRALARRLTERPLPGVREVLAAYHCLQVQFDPLITDHREMAAWVRQELRLLPQGTAQAGRLLELPVVYGGDAGPDLGYVAQQTGLPPEEVIRRHGAVEHPCYVMGFTPGFPYLGGLDPSLNVPRMDSPRLDNPPGSVALAGGQTGVYPLGGPGGWWVIGRTPWLMYDPRRDPATLLEAGDLVRFVPSRETQFPDPPPLSLGWEAKGVKVFEVLAPGAFTTVQDAGRWGHQFRGVPVSGAYDQAALAQANLLVGNDPGDAALEITLMGPRLKTLWPVVAAVAGSDLGLTIDGKTAPANKALALNPGQVLSFRGPRHGGARAVLALAGGMANEKLLDSRSTYLLGRMGAPLSKGQVLQTRPGALPPAGVWCPALEEPGEVLILRVVPGPNQEFFSPQGLQTFYNADWMLSDQADRRGARLQGQALEFAPGSPASLVSEPNTPGVIQVPSGGQPIIMLREQTVGGYPKIGTVFGPDLDLLARAQSGQVIRFEAMEAKEAVAEARRLDREFQARREGMAL